ncbi:hypothetical protein C8R44DRAFT_911520, partial [Mycena epipterygia]
ETDPILVIIDSGSDITLISRKALEALTDPPKVKAGHDLKLIQVTGRSSISGYVNIDLFFHTNDGPVKLTVEAYVVDGMSTPFIPGNDFTDQYSISIVRDEGDTYLRFGSSGRQLKVESSTSTTLLDDEGHAFKEDACQSQTAWARNAEVWALERTVISPEFSKLVSVGAYFPKNQDSIFVERKIASNGNEEDSYGAADTLISKDKPVLHVANFSKMPVIISAGQVLGTARNLRAWRDRMNNFNKEQQQSMLMLSLSVLLLLSSTAKRRWWTEAERKLIAGRDLPRRLCLSTSGTTASTTVRSETKIASKAQRNEMEPDDPLAEESTRLPRRSVPQNGWLCQDTAIYFVGQIGAAN